MKRSSLTLLLLCFLVAYSNAQSIWKQRRYEIVAGLGPSFFFGNIGGYSQTKNILGLRDIALRQTRFDSRYQAKLNIRFVACN